MLRIPSLLTLYGTLSCHKKYLCDKLLNAIKTFMKLSLRLAYTLLKPTIFFSNTRKVCASLY